MSDIVVQPAPADPSHYRVELHETNKFSCAPVCTQAFAASILMRSVSTICFVRKSILSQMCYQKTLRCILQIGDIVLDLLSGYSGGDAR